MDVGGRRGDRLWSAGPIFLERGSASNIGEALEATLAELSKAALEALAGDIPLGVNN